MGARRQLSERQKSFVRLIHEQIPPYRAYALAGYRRHHSNAYRLRENEGVKQYLSELEAQTMKRHEVTVDSLLTELEEARLHAQAAKQPSSEVSAVMGKAKLAGLLVDKQEIKEVSNMNMEELVQAVRHNMGDEADVALKALGLKADAGQTKGENQEGEKPVIATARLGIFGWSGDPAPGSKAALSAFLAEAYISRLIANTDQAANHVDLAAGDGLEEPVQSWPLLAALRPRDAGVLIDSNHVPAVAAYRGLKISPLVGRVCPIVLTLRYSATRFGSVLPIAPPWRGQYSISRSEICCIQNIEIETVGPLIRLAFSPSAAAGFSEHVQFASVSYSMEGGD